MEECYYATTRRLVPCPRLGYASFSIDYSKADGANGVECCGTREIVPLKVAEALRRFFHGGLHFFRMWSAQLLVQEA